MQILYTSQDPTEAAEMIPPGRRARLLQEAAQMLCKGLSLKPFMRSEHADQGDDLADGVRCNGKYALWVLEYCDHLETLLFNSDKAGLITNCWDNRYTGISNKVKACYGSPHNLIPVRLPKPFRLEAGLHNGLREPEEAVKIYRQLLEWKKVNSKLWREK